MGWACTGCGDVNSNESAHCEECGTQQGTNTTAALTLPPVSPGLIWVATLLGGALGGYAVALWNGRILGHQSWLRSGIYAAIGILGWLLTLVILANLSPPGNANPVEPGFGIPVALALGFLLVSIPYNLENLAINQWMWGHPSRKLVLRIGGSGKGFGPRLSYTPFIQAEGELFQTSDGATGGWAIPVVPIVVIAVMFVIGVVTLLIGNALAPSAHHHK